jgi:hypothetical protein
MNRAQPGDSARVNLFGVVRVEFQRRALPPNLETSPSEADPIGEVSNGTRNSWDR